MGCVYRAKMEGPAGASKLVALKAIHAHLAEDQDFVLMFLDEMRVAMALSHRNIVETFDAGQVDERYFMVMELVGGCSLRGLLNRYTGLRPFPLDTALFVGREVAAALEYAHRFKEREGGVIHRDVSPSNILLSPEGDVKLTDFGVAKAAGRLYVSSANLIRGKMQYMSPEQAEGKADARSDLFSLGAVIYEMLTGVPVRSTTGGIDELLLIRRPPRASTKRKGLPPGLDEMIAACLETDPDNRPNTAEEVRRVLASATFQLQAKGTLSLDPHARLERLLRRLNLPGEEPAGPQKKPEILAQAVLAEVRAIETDPDLTSAASAASAAAAEVSFSDSGDTLQDTEHSLDVEYAGDDESLVKTRAVDYAGDDESLVKTRAVDYAGDDESLVKTRAVEVSGDSALFSRTPVQTHSESLRLPRKRLAPALVAGLLLLALAGVLFWLAAGSDPAPPAAATTPDQQPVGAGGAARPDLGAPPDLGSPDLPPEPDQRVADLKPVDLRRPPAPRPRPRPRPRPPRKRFGHLDINSIPWAKVYIDGRLRGETPLEKIKLSAGAHTIRLVSRVRNLSRRYTVRVVAGKRLRKVFHLRRE